MTDVIEQEEEKTAAEETQPEKGTGTDQKSTAQTFTQEQVNKIVAKERAAWRKQSEQASSDHETIVASKDKAISERDEVITSMVDLLKKDLDIDEEEWEADFGDRDILWQFKRLQDKAGKSAKKDIPRTKREVGVQEKAPAFVRTHVV